MIRAALYARVSTTNGQDAANQLLALREVAARQGWQVVAEQVDDGISGAKGREKRSALDALLRQVTRRDVDLVAAWSVDRLGRSLQDLVAFLEELRTSGVDLYLHQQGLDTRTPAGRAMFGMLGVFAEFERALIVERVKAGMARAAAHGTKSGKPVGRPRIVTERKRAAIAASLAAGLGVRATARLHGVGTGRVVEVRDRGAVAAG
jgi:DNA invertase Pin-like site-specific DNA recombinase